MPRHERTYLVRSASRSSSASGTAAAVTSSVSGTKDLGSGTGNRYCLGQAFATLTGVDYTTDTDSGHSDVHIQAGFDGIGDFTESFTSTGTPKQCRRDESKRHSQCRSRRHRRRTRLSRMRRNRRWSQSS